MIDFFTPDCSIVEVKELMPIEQLVDERMWCYIAPNGEIQTRSLSLTKKITRWAISAREYYSNGEKVTYLDYEKKGFRLVKVKATIIEFKPVAPTAEGDPP